MEDFHLEGIVPPIITPFDKHGMVFEEGYRRLIDFLLPHVGGFYPCGSYGSGPLMSVGERMQVLEIIIDQVRGRVPIVAHVGTTHTAATIQLAQHAQANGVQAVAALPPFYYQHSEENIVAYYKALIEAVDIPVYAYDNPKLSGNTLSPELLSRLVEIGIWGVKDSSFDIQSFATKKRLTEKTGGDIVIGTEALFLPAFSLGARACISGLANAFPELNDALWKALSSENMAQELQYKILQVREIVHLAPTIPSVHAILKMRGYEIGYPRLPFQPVGDDLQAQIAIKLSALDML